jgi:hypothetical protein
VHRVAAVALVLVLLSGTAACKQPDTFNGCSRHPGQCNRTT